MSLNIALIQESFAKAKPAALDIVDRFYENLWTDYPDAKPLFATTDMEGQKKALVRALTFVVDHLNTPDKLSSYLKGMGARHVDYGVHDEHYAWVGHTLLKTFEEAFGRLWTPELAEQWTMAYETIAQLMQEGARSRTQEKPAAAPVIPLHSSEETKSSFALPGAIKSQIRTVVRAAIQDAIQREIKLALDEELGNLAKHSLGDLIRRQG